MNKFSKLLAVLILSCLPLTAMAANSEKIYFFSSIDESTFKGPFFLHWGYFEHYISGLESQFQNHFQSSGDTLVVKRNANRADLFEALHDPKAVAVFWVSHGAPFSWQAGGGALVASPELVDATGADVKDVFKSAAPNIRWISVVSCDSNEILKSEQASGGKIQGFDNLTDARVGLSQSLQKSDDVLNTPDASSVVSPSSGLNGPIEVTRILHLGADLPANYVFPSVTIQYQGLDVAAFNAVNASQVKSAGGAITETQTILIPLKKTMTAQDLQITPQSGLNAASVPAYFDLGSFSIKGSWAGASWKAFVEPKTGIPFGVTWNLFLYQGPLSFDAATIKK